MPPWPASAPEENPLWVTRAGNEVKWPSVTSAEQVIRRRSTLACPQGDGDERNDVAAGGVRPQRLGLPDLPVLALALIPVEDLERLPRDQRVASERRRRRGTGVPGLSLKPAEPQMAVRSLATSREAQGSARGRVAGPAGLVGSRRTSRLSPIRSCPAAVTSSATITLLPSRSGSPHRKSRLRSPLTQVRFTPFAPTPSKVLTGPACSRRAARHQTTWSRPPAG